MKKVRCPKCNSYTLFDETRYQPGQRLVFVCSECKKQFAIRTPSNSTDPSRPPLKGEEKKSPFKGDLEGLKRFGEGLALLCIPIAYIVSEAGWLVAEFGRQPWTIQDMLPTWVGVSQVGSSAIMLTFLLFLILFTTLLAVEISIMIRTINRGPIIHSSWML